MPQVPNYKPPEVPKRNEAELARLRLAKLARDKAKLDAKVKKMREEYWLNNPPFFKL